MSYNALCNHGGVGSCSPYTEIPYSREPSNVRPGTRPAACGHCGARTLADGTRAVVVTVNPVTIECRSCGKTHEGKS